MSTVKHLEDAVVALTSSDFAQFRAWFDDLASRRFDEAIASDAAKGNLDRLADEALKDAREGRARPL